MSKIQNQKIDLETIIERSKKIMNFKIKVRNEYNNKCLEILKKMIDEHPDWRFKQILYNLGLAEDRFEEESIDTYIKIKN